MTRPFLFALVVAGLVNIQSAAAATCESLASLTLQNGHVTSAQMVAPGAFAVPAAPRAGGAPARGAAPAAEGRGAANPGRAGAPAGRGGRGPAPNPYASLPAFCRVALTLTPSADSDIKAEVWLPEMTTWNGKFEEVGNGGWAGTITYAAMAQALKDGYATASTDTGHVGNGAQFALGHWEKVIDIAYRAIHETAVQSKAVIGGFYTSPLQKAYFNGCSLGGRQGITEAQRYPADFDGIIAGAVAWGGLDRYVGVVMNSVQMQKTPGGYIPPEKYPAVHDAVLAACDANDGVKDGVLENPLACHFDPKVLQCKPGEDNVSCLTAPQVATANMIYSDRKDPKTGKVLTGGLMKGTELQWGTLYSPNGYGNATTALQNIVEKDPNWNVLNFDPAVDIEKAQKADPEGILKSDNPNLKAFFDRGGKLFMYQGFQDPQVTSWNAIRYHQAVIDKVKGAEGKSIELFMVPGMLHCQGGPGTDTWDKTAVLDQWVTTGKAPDKVVASHLTDGKVDKTRPLCVYPKVAKYSGSGSTDDAANFTCVAPTALSSGTK